MAVCGHVLGAGTVVELPDQSAVAGLVAGTLYYDTDASVVRVSPHVPIPAGPSTMHIGATGSVLTTSLTFVAAVTFVWPGTTAMGTPAQFQVPVGVGGGSATVTVRVQDLTNGATVAGPNAASNGSLGLLALTYNNNATAGSAVWQLQFQTSSVLTSVSVGGVSVTLV